MTVEDIKKLIDFSTDYYAILGISKSDLTDDKIENARLLQNAYRKKIFEFHPFESFRKEAR